MNNNHDGVLEIKDKYAFTIERRPCKQYTCNTLVFPILCTSSYTRECIKHSLGVSCRCIMLYVQYK